MPKRSDVRTLKNLIEQAKLIADSNPFPKGGAALLRENLDAAFELVKLLLVRPTPESIAAELGTRGGKETAKRGSEYYSQISAKRKRRAGGRPKKNLDVLTSGASPASVRSRSAFLIAKRVQELGMDADALAAVIHSSTLYARNLMQGVTIPSNEKVTAIIKGLNLSNLYADQLRTFVAEDRRRNDGRFRPLV